MPNHHHRVLAQADGFHRAYELLSTAMLPTFEEPDEMPAAGQHLVSMGDFGLLVPPSVVCLAFAVELILKTLLVQEGLLPDPTVSRPPGAPRGIHDLDKLFGSLPVEYRDRIRAAVADPDFDARLAEHGKTFTDWRYEYEMLGDVNTDDGFLMSIWDAARACVLPV